jgi:hypothetical protein
MTTVPFPNLKDFADVSNIFLKPPVNISDDELAASNASQKQ